MEQMSSIRHPVTAKAGGSDAGAEAGEDELGQMLGGLSKNC